MLYVTCAFRVVLLRLEVLLYQYEGRDGDLMRGELCGRLRADYDLLEIRIRQTNLGSPHLSYRRVRVSPSRFELLDHVAGMAGQRQKATSRDRGHTLPQFFLGSRQRCDGPCRISGCIAASWSLSVSCSHNTRIHSFCNLILRSYP